LPENEGEKNDFAVIPGNKPLKGGTEDALSFVESGKRKEKGWEGICISILVGRGRRSRGARVLGKKDNGTCVREKIGRRQTSSRGGKRKGESTREKGVTTWCERALESQGESESVLARTDR